MTKESRELDAQIAVALFGWRWMKDAESNAVSLWPASGDEDYEPHGHWTHGAEDVTGRESEFTRAPDWDLCGTHRDWRTSKRGAAAYSSDWNDMKLLVDALLRRDCVVAMDLVQGLAGASWLVRARSDVFWVFGNADSLPVAMCAAALKLPRYATRSKTAAQATPEAVPAS